jgi:hypothetical protein
MASMDTDALYLEQIGTYFGNILLALFPILGLVIFIAFLYGGFRILLAGGDSKAAASGKAIITGAVISIVFAIGSWLILMIVEQLTGAKITQFNILFNPNPPTP